MRVEFMRCASASFSHVQLLKAILVTAAATSMNCLPRNRIFYDLHGSEVSYSHCGLIAVSLSTLIVTVFVRFLSSEFTLKPPKTSNLKKMIWSRKAICRLMFAIWCLIEIAGLFSSQIQELAIHRHSSGISSRYHRGGRVTCCNCSLCLTWRGHSLGDDK